MVFKCIAVDDELPALELIKNYVQLKYPPCNCCIHLMMLFLQENIYGLIPALILLLVDINMPDINGIDLVNSLAK